MGENDRQRLQAASSLCPLPLPSPTASFPKEPTEWREISAYRDGGTGNRGWAGLLEEVGDAATGAPVSVPSQTPPPTLPPHPHTGSR